MSGDELRLLGHLIGDGCTLPRHTIQYTTRELALAETVVGLACGVFGDAVAPRISQERGWYQVYLVASERLTHGKRNPVAAWLDNLGVFGLRSWQKRVPEQVFAQSPQGIAAFLRHLWATDGCIHLGAGERAIPRISYASSSEVLARHVQSLLLRLGIVARCSRTPQVGKGRDQFHVLITGRADVQAFLSNVGSLGASKVLHHEAIMARLAVRGANTNRDVLPAEVWRSVVVPAMHAAGITTRQMQAGLNMSYCGSILYKSNLSRERAGRLAPVIEPPEADACPHDVARLSRPQSGCRCHATAVAGPRARSDVYWDEIVSIEPDGLEEVYDLTVDRLHNFVAGDIVVHNSIEQDADVVLFLYREEMYDPETEKQHIADIHVAKHRNGPTGHFALYFDQQQTRFRDLETQASPL